MYLRPLKFWNVSWCEHLFAAAETAGAAGAALAVPAMPTVVAPHSVPTASAVASSPRRSALPDCSRLPVSEPVVARTLARAEYL